MEEQTHGGEVATLEIEGCLRGGSTVLVNSCGFLGEWLPDCDQEPTVGCDQEPTGG